MSLLENMRSGTDSTAMQVVLALVLLSFVFWYAKPAGDPTQVVATVNGEVIRDTEFSRLYRRAERQAGRTLSPAEASKLRESVRQQMIEDEVMHQEAQALGLNVSDEEVARQLLQIDFLKDEHGRFDETLYRQYLNGSGYYSRRDFEEELRADLIRQKLRFAVYLGTTLSDAELERVYRRQNARVEVRYVRLRPQTFEDDVQVDDEALDTYLASYADQVKSTYDADYSRMYDVPEKLRVRMIRLKLTEDGPDAEELKSRLEGLRDEIEAGADMETLARRWSEHVTAEVGGDMGLEAVGALPLALTEAMTDVEIGGLSPVVTGDVDVSLYRLEAREPAHVVPFEEVQREIAGRLIRQSMAPVEMAKYAEALRDEWAEKGAPPEEMLAEQGIATASTGQIPLDGDGGLFTPPTPMLAAAEKGTIGTVLPEVYAQDELLWVGALVDRTEANLSALELNREQIREQILNQRRFEFLQGWIADRVALADIR